MRVNFIGNTSNLHYRLAKNLRKFGIETHLYYSQNSDPQNFPQWDEPDLLKNMPDWLHPYSVEQIGRYPHRSLPSAFAREIAECDILHVEDMGVLWASQTGKPFVWDPYGWDLQFFPFYSYWQSYWQFINHPEYLLAPIAYRRAIAKASAIVYGIWYRPLANGFKLINQLLPHDRFIHSISFSIDVDRFSSDKSKSAQSLLNELGIDFDVKGLVIYHPTRMMFSSKSYLDKGNDRLFRALAKFKKAGHEFTLILGERGIPDEQIAKELLKDLEIDNRVVWLPKMEVYKLVEWFRCADIGADQFAGGALGLVSFDTMACGTPLFSYMQLESDQETFWPPSSVYEELPPIINVSTEEEIFKALDYYSHHKDELLLLGEKSREWVVNNMSESIVARKYLTLYNSILAKEAIEKKSRINFSVPLANYDSEIQQVLHNVFKLIDKKDMENAKSTLINALDLAPDNSELIKMMVCLVIFLHGYKPALAVLQYAIEILPDEPGLVSTLEQIRAKASWIILLRAIKYHRGLMRIICQIVATH